MKIVDAGENTYGENFTTLSCIERNEAYQTNTPS